MLSAVNADAVGLEEQLSVELHLLAKVFEYLLLIFRHLPEELTKLYVEDSYVAQVGLKALLLCLFYWQLSCREIDLWGVVLPLNALILPLMEDVLLGLLLAEQTHFLLFLGALQLVLVVVVEQNGMVLL